MNSRSQIQSQPAACHDDALAGLRAILRVTRPGADVALIRRAYDVAASWHEGQTRRSGHLHITHPLAVAMILAETGADDEMLCAAMLHDTIGETPYTLAALRGEFGAGVAALVAGVAVLGPAKGRRGRTAAQAMAAAESTDTRDMKASTSTPSSRSSACTSPAAATQAGSTSPGSPPSSR